MNCWAQEEHCKAGEEQGQLPAPKQSLLHKMGSVRAGEHHCQGIPGRLQKTPGCGACLEQVTAQSLGMALTELLH